MYVHFHLHYRTVFGEQIGIQYIKNKEEQPEDYLFQTIDGENWTGKLLVNEKDVLSYHYSIYNNGKKSHNEWGKPRQLNITSDRNIYVEDKWRQRANENNAFLATAFTKSIFRRPAQTPEKSSKPKISTKNKVTFQLSSASIQSHLVFGVVGNTKEFGEWKIPVAMDDSNFPLWQHSVPFDGNDLHIEYKYVVMDPKDGSIKVWEDGDNRTCHFVLGSPEGNHIIITDDHFRYNDAKWRGAGVAIPVFSLRGNDGMGIGEFTDMNLLTDWAESVGMNVIQILPVNDTIANKTWADSYPYAAISVFALHPLYINIQRISGFRKKSDQKDFQSKKDELNTLEMVDFEKVLNNKFKFLRILFDQEYSDFKADNNVQEFIKTNSEWLKPYAVFCHLRDKFNTCNFNQWPEYSTYTTQITEELCSDMNKDLKEIEFYFFIQYHADKQLSEAKSYAREKGVILKGDLPIGIYRYSCDAWVAPDLYNMGEQAGAPPDDYAILGQNWGFPTYNWTVMAKDGFGWWRKRMQQLNRYFDAMRIDHILGFFRIWQIPTHQVEGTMGMFNPRLPVSRDELAGYGISGDLTRYTMPFITYDILGKMYGNDLEDIFDIFFSPGNGDRVQFKTSFDNQQKISVFVSQNPKYSKHEKSLLNLMTEVLLLTEPGSEGQFFNPRITLSTTQSYGHLDHNTKAKFNSLYNDYYFSRHDEYWKQQALWKLPAILDASDMLICGEDLGMIPKAVPGVMKDMNIISLEIQRMPKGNSKFGQVRNYPYFSVCSPSCHDMSTIRGWWEGDHENAKDFYYNYLHWYGLTPMQASPEIVNAIVEDHLASPSMLAIFPIQDLVGIDGTLRKSKADSEQINEPSNPKHYWRFRFHISMEDLLKSESLNEKLRSMVRKSGR